MFFNICIVSMMALLEIFLVGVLLISGLKAQYVQVDPQELLNVSYVTYYPQYEYKPYTGDCNRQEYGVYTEFLYNFRRDWYDIYTYRPYEMNEEEQYYWNSYGGGYYSDYPSVSYGPLHQGACCWMFEHDFPERKVNTTTGRQRREYRQLSLADRSSLHDAMNAMKSSGQWDIFVHLHRASNAPYAHYGAAFLPWHREFLFRLENALIANGYTGPGLPYVDTTLDQLLPNPADSVLWNRKHLGNLFGPVTIGFAAHWSTIAECHHRGAKLTRQGINGPRGQCFLFSDFDLDYVFGKKCFKDITCNTDCKFESDHGAVHNFVGGHMGTSACAPSDPFFFLHHAFVDCVWETFRQNHQITDVEKEYPSWVYNMDDIGSPSLGYEWFSPMQPFSGLVNAHGIQNFYQTYYECLPRPNDCSTDIDCGSSTLWCNGNGRCVSKVRRGGNCQGLPNKACNCPGERTPTCQHGICSCQQYIIERGNEGVGEVFRWV